MEQSVPLGHIRRAVSEHIETELRKRSTTYVAVPLSVGLDSRFILGCLRDVIGARNIHVFTAGQPGNYEFEFSKFLYKNVIPNHLSIDLTNWHWDADSVLADISAYPNAIVFNWPNFFKALGLPVMMHGYMGDTLAGAHLPRRPSQGRRDARAFFFSKFKTNIARRYNFDNPLTTSRMNALYLNDLPDKIVDTSFDIAFRQVQRIRPHHLQQNGMFCPFENKDVMKIFLNLPLEDRLGERRYIKECCSEFPDLFKEFRFFRIKRKSQYDTIRKTVLKVNNKIFTKFGAQKFTSILYDWASEIKRNNELRSLLLSQLSELRERQIPLPWNLSKLKNKLYSKDDTFINTFWQEYQFSLFLELNIKAKRIKS